MTGEGGCKAKPVYDPASYAAHLQALAEAGFMVFDRPDMSPERRYAVCTGSHGGHGKTPQQAVKACLRCCGIGHWWEIDGRSAKAIVKEIYQRFDGAWK